MKYCSNCKRELPLAEFHVDKGHADGRSSRCKECRRRWVASRKAETSNYNARYYALNRERRLAEIHHYQEQHPEVKVGYRHRYRARKRNADGSHTLADLTRIFERQGGRSYYCDRRMFAINEGHFDHVIPLSRGGSDGPENLVFACPPCNWKKHARMPDEDSLL